MAYQFRNGQMAQQQPTAEETLKTQQEVSLDHTDIPELSACHSCPSLEVLSIRTALEDRNRDVQTSIDTDTIIHYMEQLSMTKMIIWDMTVNLAQDNSGSSYPPVENLNPLGRISVLELRQININVDTLTKLFRTCADLRSFTLTRPSANRGGILLYDIAVALRTVSHSLTSLTLGYNGVRKPSEPTLLPPLNHLQALLHLKIDPSMYIGRRLCPNALQHHPIVVTRPPSSFADLLPNGLESLTLDIDIEQVWRAPGYRRDIVKSVIDARGRLPNLKEITLFEDEATGVNACGCGQCYAQMSHIWRGGRRGAEEVAERKEWVKVLRKMGITVFRDSGNGQGRQECTLWGNA